MPSTQTADAARPIVIRSISEATARRDRTVEAEHLLLAVLRDPWLPATRALTAAGPTADWWQDALAEERHQTLRSAGIESVEEPRLQSTPSGKRPAWGASAREALKRGSLYAVDRGHRHRMDDVDMVLGVLDARMGTIARIAARNGLDVTTLADRLRAA
ncbi:Clp protease N-terminal domain-containing protein [Arthrobacter sp.]|uniref:Clp protease N-terminal domain-containing protein n=1 Tax=Arthrobacter sp. TaxID=1667 RepID=UPI003A8FE940